MCCSQLCSYCGWLLLKCSAIGIGFNGAETNCRIAHILGILLMNSCNTDRFLATTVVYGLSTLNYDNGTYHGIREPIRKLENHYPELKIY